MHNDYHIIRNAIDGDEEALEKLILHYYPFVYKYLVKITSNPLEAEDYTHETVLKIIRNIHRYNFKSSFATWAITIATRIYIDDKRKHKNRSNLIHQLEKLGNSGLNDNQEIENRQIIHELLYQLPDEQRISIVLFYFHELRYKEISQILNVPEGTIKTRVHYGLQKLKEWMRDENDRQN